MSGSQRTLLSLALLVLVTAQWLPTALAFYRGRPGSSLALAKRLESDLAGSEDDEYGAIPALEAALEWRSRFPPSAADISSFYPFFRQSPSALAKKNKDPAARSLETAGGNANRKFQTQGWRR
ncbi:hypothetical protein IscW_ISCW007668 [Ixodes scapularis]|uniref:Uncharacterized protein n=1 Tax=Ixodes scapularis TaxID=6945 RepID=B7PSM6_IXOSC|nr:hypothetical protein IscW_ISCW007668 [Ixodes scapularis]|eukprot:XP_002402736.1 hypothetical protein IscW_ISCW007668 [Ixodes scapularis]